HFSLYGSNATIAPIIEREVVSDKEITTLRNVFMLGTSAYTLRKGGMNRFGHLVSDLVGLPYTALPSEQTLPLIPMPPDNAERAQQLAKTHQLDATKQRIAICIEGSEDRKRWSLDHYAQTAALLEQSAPDRYEYDIFSLFENYTPEEVTAAFT